MGEHIYFVYILTNRRRTVLYTGVTSNLKLRIFQHKRKTLPGFTSRYNVDRLVFFEQTPNVDAAIAREKQIKSGSRAKKEALINALNPEWRDLSDDWR